MYLVDTNVLVELAKNSPAGQRAASFLSAGSFRTTIINISELFKWLEKQCGEPDLAAVLPFAKSIELQEITFDDAMLAGTFSAKHKLYLVDAIMLAVAANHNIALVTMDSDFERVKGAGAKIIIIKK
ncbi:MAG: PIN domain-containing protein [Candidatus Micrarchaeota archaeon]